MKKVQENESVNDESGNISKPLLTVVSWSEREKYGCLGKYIVNKEIYHYVPASWNQKARVRTEKGTIIEVIEYKDKNVLQDQFITNSGNWFTRDQITPIA